jgi:hypothetical protein
MAGTVRFVSLALRASSLNEREGGGWLEADNDVDVRRRFTGDD